MPPHTHEHAFVLNAGLPRTGTTSFSLATRMAGMHALHSWEPQHPLGTEDRRDRWWREQYEQVLLGKPGELIRYDSLSDNPFMFQTARFRSAYPNATIVCTTRERSKWVQSMLKCKPHNCAGGLYLPRQFPQIALSYPYRNDSATIDSLSALFDLHYQTECSNATLLDLRMSSNELWRRLCSVVPEQHVAPCWSQLYAGRTWPGTSVSSPPSVTVGPGIAFAATDSDTVTASLENASCPYEIPDRPEYLPSRYAALDGTCPAWVRPYGINTPTASCAEATIVGQGFGSYFHRIAQAALFAWTLGARLVPKLHPRVQDYSPILNASHVTRDIACLSKPLQHSCLFDVRRKTGCKNNSQLGTVYPGLGYTRLGLTRQNFFREVSAMMATLLQPRGGLREALSLPAAPQSCIAVQIRAGDSCIKAAVRRKCDPLAAFLNATMVLVDRYQIHDVVVASDSASERNKFVSSLPAWVRVTTPPTESSQLVGDSLLDRQTTVEQRWQEDTLSGANDLKAFLTDVESLSACSAFVGKLTSNVARLVLEIMSARRGRVVPYVSLDVAWCFGGRAFNPREWNMSAFPCI